MNGNPNWLGDAVGYVGLHGWIKRRLKKPDLCQSCNENKAYDLANISQKYKRDLADWEWLCRVCHMTKDGRRKKLIDRVRRAALNRPLRTHCGKGHAFTLENTYPYRRHGGLARQHCRICRRQANLKSRGVFKMIVLALLPSLLLASCGTKPAYAEINQTQAVKAIIGEAANQGLDGMTAVAEVIRNRGHLKGFYGAKREAFILAQPNWVHRQALKAWLMSESSNLTKNATHFENVKAFGRPKWSSKMTKTAVIKDHVFYRDVKP